MKNSTVLATFAFVAIVVAAVADDNPVAPFDATRLNRDLPSTWENTAQANAPREVHFIKNVAPTHFAWITYDRDKKEVLGVAGGTWSLKDGKYQETIEFASDNAQALRGKTYRFTIDLKEDRWEHKTAPDSEIEVDEVWSRMKQADHQRKNSGEPGRQLLGAWDEVFPPGAPKSLRTIKFITPTHWTWVTFDRENRRVLAAAGGTWSLRDGEYVEACEFSTENFPQPRGHAYPFEFRVDGDRWVLRGGFNRAIREDQTWARLKKPNP